MSAQAGSCSALLSHSVCGFLVPLFFSPGVARYCQLRAPAVFRRASAVYAESLERSQNIVLRGLFLFADVGWATGIMRQIDDGVCRLLYFWRSRVPDSLVARGF